MTNFDKLDLIKLMHPNNATCIASSRTRFTTKASRTSCKFKRQGSFCNNFLTIQICKRNLCGRRQKMRPFIQSIHVFFKLRKLSCSFHTVTSYKERHSHFGVTVRASMKIKKKINKSSFEACS